MSGERVKEQCKSLLSSWEKQQNSRGTKSLRGQAEEQVGGEIEPVVGAFKAIVRTVAFF